jgi:hypothetical protein
VHTGSYLRVLQVFSKAIEKNVGDCMIKFNGCIMALEELRFRYEL